MMIGHRLWVWLTCSDFDVRLDEDFDCGQVRVDWRVTRGAVQGQGHLVIMAAGWCGVALISQLVHLTCQPVSWDDHFSG